VRCPLCGFDSTRVVDSRLTDPGDAIRRRRECAGCGGRFTTYERAEGLVLVVRKREGRSERYDRQKLLGGLLRAATKRPVTVPQLEAVADSIESAARRRGGEADAEWIGELALRGLIRLDAVAAIRFASVYRNFDDLAQFAAEIRTLEAESVPGPDQMALEAALGGPVPSELGRSIGASPSGGRRPRTEPRRDDVREP
jgi:transcriptional repressor NrdR